jgi:two-component system NarL family sensor kinase
MNQVDNHITLLVLIGMAGMLILVTGFLLSLVYAQRKRSQHQYEMQALKEIQQNQLIEAAVRSEETERHRIAEQLHDEVGAILSATKLHFLGIKPEHLNERDLQLHTKSKELLDDAIQKVRTIAHNLHSNILKEFGLNEAIRHFMKKITDGSMITTHLNLDDGYDIKESEDDISAYRLFQELLNNILKHAEPSEVKVESRFKENILSISITHNGNGLTQEDFEALRYKTEGLGLRNIQNRVILLKGLVTFSRQGNSYSIIFRIPKNNTTL